MLVLVLPDRLRPLKDEVARRRNVDNRDGDVGRNAIGGGGGAFGTELVRSACRCRLQKVKDADARAELDGSTLLVRGATRRRGRR